MINEILKEVGSAKNKDEKEFNKSLKAYLSGAKLECSIKDYWEKRENNKTAVQQKYPDLIKQLTFFFMLLSDINQFKDASYKEKKDKAGIKQRINVCSALYNKSLQTFLDTFGLLEDGAAPSVFLLWRSIYENFAVSKYLMNSTDEEAGLFNEYMAVQRRKLLGGKITKEEKTAYIKKLGRDFDANDYCWAKSIKGKKSFPKIIKVIKENKLFKFYLLSAYFGNSNSFTVNKVFEYNETRAKTITPGFTPDDVTKSLNALITVLNEFAVLMIDNFIDDKKQKEQLKRVISYYSKEIDKKWKKF